MCVMVLSVATRLGTRVKTIHIHTLGIDNIFIFIAAVSSRPLMDSLPSIKSDMLTELDYLCHSKCDCSSRCQQRSG